MASYLLAWLFCFYNPSPFQPKPIQQADKSVKVNGTCYDIATAVRLKVKATALLESRKVSLGESDDLGIFHLQIPDSTNFLVFESLGYQPVTVPVSLGSEAGSKLEFSFAVPMAAVDSQRLELATQVIINFFYLDSLNLDYRLTNAGNPKQFASFRGFYSHKRKLESSFRFGSLDNSDNYNLKPGNYIFTGHSTDGQLIVNEEVTVKEGLNFKSVVVKKPEESLDPATLYFEQSSYSLQSATKDALDSVAQFLLKNRDKAVQITGHTDNVGKRNLNVILSEYRARRTVNYLERKGVPSDQIIFKWQGPDSPAAPNDVEENKAKNRRVVIEVIPK